MITIYYSTFSKSIKFRGKCMSYPSIESATSQIHIVYSVNGHVFYHVICSKSDIYRDVADADSVEHIHQ